MSDAATLGAAEMTPLRRGRHDLPPELVRESQQRRLMTAAAATLASRGYGGITVTEVAKLARVSTATFYKRFDDIWACLAAAYEADAALLCERVEKACGAAEAGGGKRGAAIEAALELLASDPPLAHLLSAEPPARATALREARRRLVERLAGLLAGAEESREREARQIGAVLALISSRARREGAARLGDLSPTLGAILRAPAATPARA